MLELDQAGESGRRSREVALPPEVEGRVEGVWIQGPRDPGPRGWRIVPDPNPHVVVSVSGGAVRSRLVGPRSRSVLSRGGRRRSVIVRLRAGVLPDLLGDDAVRLRDRSIPLSEVAPPEMVARLEEAVLRGAPGAMEGLVGLLRACRARAPALDWRLRALEDAGRRGERPGDVVRRTGVAPRTLRAVSARGIGLSPELVLRIRRLHRALRMGLREDGSWERSAVAAGYHDAPHFVRECRALLGETPGAFGRRRRAGHAG